MEATLDSVPHGRRYVTNRQWTGRLMNKIIIRNIVIAITAIAVVSLIYLFLWGKLFPYSPIIIGFSKHELSNSIIYVQNGSSYSELKKIDDMIPEVENFHELKFVRKPKIYIFSDKDCYLRRTVTKARFFAYPYGSMVISPLAIKEAAEGKISLEIYVRHELSHVLLLQDMSLLTAYRSPKWQWLAEGVAVYSTQQMGTSWYPGKEETLALIRKGNFMPPEFFKTRKEDQVLLNVPYRVTFMYSEFACIVDYLITMDGKEKFLDYLKRSLKNGDHAKAFKDVYGIDFNNFLLDFKEFIQHSEKS
jgi:hypothetical protein